MYVYEGILISVCFSFIENRAIYILKSNWLQLESTLIYFKVTTEESRISKLLSSKKLSLVNKILCLPGSLYTIDHMLNSKNLTIVNDFGDKTEFTILWLHCIKNQIN